MVSVGIDIIEVPRARSIYRAYRSRLKRILASRELSYLHSSRSKSRAFAEILAVKEAVFKALEIPWFGLEGWKKIGLRIESPHRFSVLFGGDLKKHNSKRHRIWINVASTKKFVLARALREW